MMSWWAGIVFFATILEVDASSVRTNSTSYLFKNGTIIIEDSEKDFYPEIPVSGICPKCSCPPIVPQCEPGVSLVTDGCGCCKICAGQLGATCDREHVCDQHKGLYCDRNSHTCKARPGRGCFFSNKWRENGETFSPSCRISCSCIDGDIGCFPKCKPPPPGCAYPRLSRSASNCCGEWRCASRPSEYAIRGSVSSLSFRGSCILQTTPWSPCSKTCSFGVSERVTNDNADCMMTKETRLCIIRPCKASKLPKKPKRSCRRHIRRNKRVRYSLSGCLSVKSFRPRYCGTCRDTRKCCKPNLTKTVDIEFECTEVRFDATETYRIKKKMMLIQNCTCGHSCSNNDLPGPPFGLSIGRDTVVDT